MSSGGETEEPRVEPRVVTYPLKLQASHGPGRALNSGSSGATEGAFGGRSPYGGGILKQGPRVESDGGSIIRLRDADGVFLEVVAGDSGGGDASVVASDGEERTRKLEERSRKRKLGKVVEVHRRRRVYSARDGEADFAEAERTEVEMALDAARERITGLEAELETAAQRNMDLVKEVKVLSERVRGERDKTHERITVLEAELERAARHNADLKEEVELLREKVREEGQKNRGLWVKN